MQAFAGGWGLSIIGISLRLLIAQP
ncbi:hypothetical protein EMIT0P4_400021 [Pseudomonas sp. IT-P4]